MADDKEKKKAESLRELPTIYVVSLLPSDTSAGFEGHPVALHDVDIRHPGGPSVVVSGRIPVRVASTPAVAAAIKNSQIKEVSEDEARDLISKHAIERRERRRQALQESEEGYPDEFSSRRLGEYRDEEFGRSLLKAGRDAGRDAIRREMPQDDPGGSKEGMGSLKAANRVNPNRMGLEDLRAMAAKMGVEVPEKATKGEIADAINAKIEDSSQGLSDEDGDPTDPANEDTED
jgi:hypothetical protein